MPRQGNKTAKLIQSFFGCSKKLLAAFECMPKAEANFSIIPKGNIMATKYATFWNLSAWNFKNQGLQESATTTNII